MNMLLLALCIRPTIVTIRNLVTLVLLRLPEHYSNFSRSRNNQQFICFAAVRLDKMTYTIISRYFLKPWFLLVLNNRLLIYIILTD